MSDINEVKETSRGISSLEWGEFPLEVDKFSCLICLQDKNENKEEDLDTHVQLLKNLFYMINPQKMIKYINRFSNSKKFSYDKESTLLVNLNKEFTWEDEVEFMNIYNESKYHILAIGELKNIPKIILSSSDLIVFEHSSLTKNYFHTQRVELGEFDNKNYFPVANKTGSTFDVKVIQKSSLENYKKVPLLFD